MTQEDKELLLKDLCARLPYGVIGVSRDGVQSPLLVRGKAEWDIITSLNYRIVKYGWKPYLRTMDSMTEEEFVYFMGLRGRMLKSHEIQSIMKESFNMPLSIGIGTTLGSYSNKIDWLNAHHFDYRGLIEKNIAIEVTKDNNPYKE